MAAGLLAFSVVATLGVTGYRVVHEPLPLTSTGGGFCGSWVGTDVPPGTDTSRMAASFLLRNPSDRAVHVDSLHLHGGAGLERVDVSAAVLEQARDDLGNAIGDVTSVSGGHALTPPRDLTVPAHGALLVVADMHLERSATAGTFTGVRVDWSGALGVEHRDLLAEKVGMLTPDDQDGCFS